MRIAGKHATSLSEGRGVNYTLFFQGCDVHCKGCHNPETWALDGGKEVSPEDVKQDILSYVPPVSGISFCGGEPSLQMDDVLELAKWAKDNGLTTTLYTGHLISEIKPEKVFDYVIDGAYEDCHRERLPFRGSSNQRIFKLIDGEYIHVEYDDDGNEYVGSTLED